jgi:hypothetical protein
MASLAAPSEISEVVSDAAAFEDDRLDAGRATSSNL